MTIAETDRADNNGNLKALFKAQEPLLHDIIGKQHEVFTILTSFKDSLDALQDKIDQSQTPGTAGSVLVNDQEVILSRDVNFPSSFEDVIDERRSLFVTLGIVFANRVIGTGVSHFFETALVSIFH